MQQFLVYDLKVACLIAIFYMFYRLLLAHETMHRLNRLVLLSTAFLSFVLPLCVFTIHRVVTVPAAADIQVGMPEGTFVVEETNNRWLLPLTVLFIVGALLTLAHSLFSIIQVIRFISKSERHPQADGTVIVVTDTETAPFSWMRYIVLNRADYLAHDAAILTHERGHIRHHHSWDVLFTYMVTPLQWFNPAIWMLRADLRSIHEYEADKEVLSQGINARQYQLLLVTKAMASGGYTVANSLSHSTLKKRIHMMLRKESNANRSLKVLFLLPIIAVSLLLNATTKTTYLPTATQGVDQLSSPTPSAVSANPQADPITDDGYVYIVDGKQMTDISSISANDIESMTVLRGESARKLGYNRNVIIVKLKKTTSNPTTVAEERPDVFDVCEQMPVFPGGMEGMMKYLMNNVKYPEEASAAGIQGRVLVSFVINENGEISDASITKSVDELLDKEALRVVSEMPNWTPGKQKGENVRVRYTLPIQFKLRGEDTSTPTTANHSDDNSVKADTINENVQ